MRNAPASVRHRLATWVVRLRPLCANARLSGQGRILGQHGLRGCVAAVCTTPAGLALYHRCQHKRWNRRTAARNASWRFAGCRPTTGTCTRTLQSGRRPLPNQPVKLAIVGRRTQTPAGCPGSGSFRCSAGCDKALCAKAAHKSPRGLRQSSCSHSCRPSSPRDSGTG